MLETFPKVLHKRLHPSVAGEAIVARYREAGAADHPAAAVGRHVGRYAALESADRQADGARRRVQEAAQELDARANEEQPTSA